MTSRHTDSVLTLYGTYVNGKHRRKVDQEGQNTPKALRDVGIFTENPYIGTKVVDIDPVCKVGTSPGNYNQLWPASSLGGRPAVYPDFVQYHSAIDLLGKLEEKWKGSQFNIGVTVGEGRESAQMMYHRLGGIYRSVRSLKRGNFGGALRELTGQVPKSRQHRARTRMNEHDITGAWLELNLGWSPMIKDIFEAAELVKLKERKNRIIVSKARKGIPMVNGNQLHWEVTGKCERRMSVIVDVTRNPTLIEAMGLTDPASIMWELVPFSFVADWVSPIGNYLANLHAVGALPAKKVIITKSEKLHGHSRPLASPVGGLHHQFDFPRIVYKASRVERSIYSSMQAAFTATDFMPTSITAKWDPDLWKISTAVSLVHHIFRDVDVIF
jgi:hypothetical protein